MSLRREARSLEITLYTVLQSEMGLNSESEDAQGIFGISDITVALTCQFKEPLTKKSFTASTKLLPTKSQDIVKNSTVNPSGPEALFLGRAQTTSLISSEEGILIN